MSYSSASLLKVRSALFAAIEGYAAKNPDEYKITISSGNVKIGRVMNFSLAPLLTCGKACRVCAGICYDIKACLQYPNSVIDARARNTAMAQNHLDVVFSRIDEAMSRRRKNKFFRWHVAGDIISEEYFAMMVRLAWLHPDFVIWTYTKQYSLVNAYCDKYGRDAIPSNFSIMFSKWDGLAMPNPYNFPVFNCRLKDGNKDTSDSWFDSTYKCPGNCDICKACGRGCVAGESAWCDEH